MGGDSDDGNGGNTDMMQRIQSSFGTSSSSIPKQQTLLSANQLDLPQLNQNQLRARHFSQFATNFGGDSSKRVGIPPSHPNQIPPISPYSSIPVSRPGNQQMGSQNYSPGPTHSRSLSQPSSFFSLDSLPPLSPSPFRDSPSTSMSDQVSTDVSMEDRDGNSHSLLPPSPFNRGNASRIGESLPPRNKHRRSNSDIPFGFSTVMQSSSPLISPRFAGGLDKAVSGRENSGVAKPAQLVKKESSWERGGENNGEGMGERKSEGEVVDDLFSAYMNLENIDALNSSGTDDKNGNENREDLDSRASGTKTNGGDSSDNEAESSVNESGNSLQRAGMNSSAEKREGIKRTAGGDVASTTRHYRSVSMDSFMGKLNFGDESPKLPPSPGTRPGQLSPSNSIDANSPAFSLEFGNGEFSGAELKKIMANEKLAEIALTDPKRAKRYCYFSIHRPFIIIGRPSLHISSAFVAGAFQDFGKSSVGCSFQREEDALYFRAGAQGSNTTDRSHHIVCPAYAFTGKGLLMLRDFGHCYLLFLFLKILLFFLLYNLTREIQLGSQTRIMN